MCKSLEGCQSEMLTHCFQAKYHPTIFSCYYNLIIIPDICHFLTPLVVLVTNIRYAYLRCQCCNIQAFTFFDEYFEYELKQHIPPISTFWKELLTFLPTFLDLFVACRHFLTLILYFLMANSLKCSSKKQNSIIVFTRNLFCQFSPWPVEKSHFLVFWTLATN